MSRFNRLSLIAFIAVCLCGVDQLQRIPNEDVWGRILTIVAWSIYAGLLFPFSSKDGRS